VKGDEGRKKILDKNQEMRKKKEIRLKSVSH
jgi:hypothetical protein